MMETLYQQCPVSVRCLSSGCLYCLFYCGTAGKTMHIRQVYLYLTSVILTNKWRFKTCYL